jgi:hypothetical protein
MSLMSQARHRGEGCGPIAHAAASIEMADKLETLSPER